MGAFLFQVFTIGNGSTPSDNRIIRSSLSFRRVQLQNRRISAFSFLGKSCHFGQYNVDHPRPYPNPRKPLICGESFVVDMIFDLNISLVLQFKRLVRQSQDGIDRLGGLKNNGKEPALFL